MGYADYAVLAATLLVSAAIGLYYRFTGGRQGLFHTCMPLRTNWSWILRDIYLHEPVPHKDSRESVLLFQFSMHPTSQRTDDEYVLADRSASVAPVAFSLMASFMSAITLLGVTRLVSGSKPEQT